MNVLEEGLIRSSRGALERNDNLQGNYLRSGLNLQPPRYQWLERQDGLRRLHEAERKNVTASIEALMVLARIGRHNLDNGQFLSLPELSDGIHPEFPLLGAVSMLDRAGLCEIRDNSMIVTFHGLAFMDEREIKFRTEPIENIHSYLKNYPIEQRTFSVAPIKLTQP